MHGFAGKKEEKKKAAASIPKVLLNKHQAKSTTLNIPVPQEATQQDTRHPVIVSKISHNKALDIYTYVWK